MEVSLGDQFDEVIISLMHRRILEIMSLYDSLVKNRLREINSMVEFEVNRYYSLTRSLDDRLVKEWNDKLERFINYYEDDSYLIDYDDDSALNMLNIIRDSLEEVEGESDTLKLARRQVNQAINLVLNRRSDEHHSTYFDRLVSVIIIYSLLLAIDSSTSIIEDSLNNRLDAIAEEELDEAELELLESIRYLYYHRIYVSNRDDLKQMLDDKLKLVEVWTDDSDSEFTQLLRNLINLARSYVLNHTPNIAEVTGYNLIVAYYGYR